MILQKEGSFPKDEWTTNLLVSDRIGCLAHELLDMLDAAHLRVYLLEDFGALLQAKDHVLLDHGELNRRCELLELLELGVGLLEEGLLVFLAAQGEQRARLVALGEHLLGNGRLLVREDGDAALVLVELIALELEVEDGPGGERWSVGEGSRRLSRVGMRALLMRCYAGGRRAQGI